MYDDFVKEINNLRCEKEQLNSLVNSCQEEIRKLKKQLEEINKMIEKCGFVNIEQVMLNYCGLLNRQKEFIEWLEDEIKLYENDIQTFSKNYNMYFSLINDLKVGKARTKDILQKYEEKIGVSDENNIK